MTTTDERPGVAPEVVDGAAVLDEARAFLARFVAMPPAALDAVALWCAHAHATDKDRVLLFGSTPRLALLSDEPGCGKTRALELIELLVPRPVRCSNPTAPGLTRVINGNRATVLIDEIDKLFGRGRGKQDVQSILNGGYRPGTSVLTAAGATATFGPVALAGLGATFTSSADLAPTYQRSICVWMTKPGDDVDLAEFRDRLHAPVGLSIGEALADWARSESLTLATAWPDLPADIRGRDADVWEPLVTVADVAGGHWPETARAACLELALGAGDSVTLPPGARLLADLEAIWSGDKLPTATIIDRLYELPGGGWRGMWPDPARAGRELAALLKPYQVTPRKVWADGRALQGYDRADFLPLWAGPEGGRGADLGSSGLPLFTVDGAGRVSGSGSGWAL